MRPDVLADHLGQTIRGLVGPMALRLAALEATHASVSDLGQRVAALEARPLIPGPPGPPGPPGRDGLDGKSLNYLGVHVAGKTYDVGDLVTDHGSVFYCAKTTEARPGASPDWQLMVKRGQDAKGAR